MLRSLIAGAVAVLVVATIAAAGNGPPATVPPVDPPVAPPVEEGEAEDEVEAEDAGPPEDLAEMVQANKEFAAMRAEAALAHAEAIRAWTACIAANAANPEGEPRDDTFDPKIGCEKPTPPTAPGEEDDGTDVEGEDTGPPDGIVGPPDWVPGPPPPGEREDD
jgi:hypothetical protein